MVCQLCGREGDGKYFEEHHLYPIKTRRLSEETILVCTTCGDQIHLVLGNSSLQKSYHTLGSLRAVLADYIEWVKDKPIETHFSMQKKKRKK